MRPNFSAVKEFSTYVARLLPPERGAPHWRIVLVRDEGDGRPFVAVFPPNWEREARHRFELLERETDGEDLLREAGADENHYWDWQRGT